MRHCISYETWYCAHSKATPALARNYTMGRTPAGTRGRYNLRRSSRRKIDCLQTEWDSSLTPSCSRWLLQKEMMWLEVHASGASYQTWLLQWHAAGSAFNVNESSHFTVNSCFRRCNQYHPYSAVALGHLSSLFFFFFFFRKTCGTTPPSLSTSASCRSVISKTILGHVIFEHLIVLFYVLCFNLKG